MTDKEKIQALKQAYDDIVWMAIRYADGRHTYAPSMVRGSVKQFKKVFPDWELKEDHVIERPKNVDSFAMESDYLYDLFLKP